MLHGRAEIHTGEEIATGVTFARKHTGVNLLTTNVRITV